MLADKLRYGDKIGVIAPSNPIYKKTGLITFHGNDILWGWGRNITNYDKKEFINRFIMGKKEILSSGRKRRTVIEGRASGVLLGGNLRCLLKLAGTPYFPDFKDSIFFFEDITEDLAALDSLLTQVEQPGIFEKLKGIIIGYIDGIDNNEMLSTRTEEILLEKLDRKNNKLPVLKAPDFGHNCANSVLPVGVKVEINTYGKEINIVEEFLH